MSPPPDETISSVEARELSREAVGIWKEIVGRGASHARAYGGPGSVCLVFHDVLTQSERTLMEVGMDDHVRGHRRALFETVRPRMIEAMAKAADAPVESVLYDIDPEHDNCAFTFVFARQGPSE